MRRTILITLFVFVATFALAAVPQQKVQADSSVTAYDLIAMVNSIRTSQYGLPALVENSYLDYEAQWTAEKMAAINANTHLYFLNYDGVSERAASVGFGGGKTVFVTENWYGGYTATLSDIQSGWADEEHMYPMTKAQYTYVGAGVATASNGMTYYVLQAGYISGETAATSAAIGSSSSASSASSSASSEAALSDWIAQVYTSTPSPDGYIYHVVQTNQMLSNIATAYGVTVDYLVELNKLSSADAIYVGQVLTIKAAPTATITPTLTATGQYPTRTPTLETTPTPYLSPTPTPKPSLVESLPKLDRGNFGLLLVIVSALGLILVVTFNFVKLPKKPVKEAEKTPESQAEKKPARSSVSKPAAGTSVRKPAASRAKKAVADLSHKPIDVPIKTSKKTTKK